MKLRDVSSFTDNEYKQQAQHKNFSAFANIMSGLNFSSNKVIYTLFSENITQFQKTETVANITALKTDYHGGSSNLNGVIFGNIKHYVGGNNLSLIDKKGDMGSRLNPVCAAPRYNFVKKGKYFDLLFNKDDANIIPFYLFEGKPIEFKFMLFCLPLLVINGNEGIGSGYAQKIYPRDIKETAEYIKSKLYNKDTKKILPSFNGFTGTIEEREEINQFKITGKIDRLGKTRTRIIEVPIGETHLSMIKKLNALVDKKVIKDYDDLCDTRNDTFNFLIKHEAWSKTDTEIIELLKLTSNISENYTVIDENNKLVVFNNIYEILDYFIKIRLFYYEKRKNYIIEQMKIELNTLKNKFMFVKKVSSGEIEITNQTKASIEEKLLKLNFDKIEGNYDYLLHTRMYNITIEKIKDLENDINELQKELDLYEQRDIKEIWVSEIDNLLKALNIKTNTDKVQPKKKETYEEVIVDTKDILSLF